MKATWRLHSEISPDFLNLLMILWTVDEGIPKFLATVHWETLFLNCWTICSHSCSQSGAPHPCLWMTEPFGDPPFIPNHDAHLFPINLFTKNSCFWSIPQLSQSFVAPVPALLDRFAGIKFKMSEYLQETIVYQFEPEYSMWAEWSGNNFPSELQAFNNHSVPAPLRVHHFPLLTPYGITFGSIKMNVTLWNWR